MLMAVRSIYKLASPNIYVYTRGLHSWMAFTGNRIFPRKIWEISRPEHSRTSSSRYRLSTGIRDWLLCGKEWFNIYCLPLIPLTSKILKLEKWFYIWNTPNANSNANWIHDSVNGEYSRNGRGDIHKWCHASRGDGLCDFVIICRKM